MPTFTGQLGAQGSQQGLIQLGATGTAVPSIPVMPTAARPWGAHLYNNDWSYRGSLGPLTNRPVIHQVLNSGYQPVTITLPALNSNVQPGNLIVVTEQGGDATGTAPTGMAIYGGIVESLPVTQDAAGWQHGVVISPFVAELGDTYLNRNYSTATDVAQMVRDAVAQTNHLRVTPYSCPNTGITALYNFSFASGLEVIDHARLIAGPQWSWFVDAVGVVWFQPINTTGSAIFTVKPSDYSSLQSNGGDISGLKNYILVIGGQVNGVQPAPATYSNATSQAKYGLRALSPPISVPGVSDTTTLLNIANSAGAVYDRIINRVTLDLPAYSQRIQLGVQGGATMRYFNPSKYPLTESESGTGAYSPTYVVLEVQTDGIQQSVLIGDIAYG